MEKRDDGNNRTHKMNVDCKAVNIRRITMAMTRVEIGVPEGLYRTSVCLLL